MEDSAIAALVMQFVAGFIASLLVLRQVAGVLVAVFIGAIGTTIGGFLLPWWSTGLEIGNLHLMITSVAGALITAWLLRLIILFEIRRRS